MVGCGDASRKASENVKPKLKEYTADEVTIPNETQKTYYENGQLRSEGATNESGAQMGIWKWYHENGTLASEGDYVDGYPTGTTKVYYENGQLRIKKENYIDGGKKDGICMVL